MIFRVRFIHLFVLSVLSTSALAAPIPKEAQSLILKVHVAASKKDTETLKKLMVTEFIWGFGGDGDAEQAIQAWKADTSLFKKLYHVTGRDCFEKPDHSIECPKNAGTSYRAGFKKTTKGWRMFYFVGGD
ncbi:hypothetical protein [Methylophilus sp. TWE2]|uniref:hypothetical protein n=1 Tax=Methylophilus sp. TWE2 TaxID=1662285 RepID=UPI0006710C29|nr:hypothetical protein [Methylophilus sp. TWE2]AKR43189.1 hypothetical protein ACJ67_06935 [Methylophilus sp. TWE2]